MLIFSAQQGRVARIKLEETSRPAVITFLGDVGFDYPSLHVIISSTGLSLKPSYQVSDTIGGEIYMVTFGESISPVPIRGVILDAVCQETNNDLLGGPVTYTGSDGLEKIVTWWKERNLTSSEAPIVIQMAGDFTFDAYIADLNIANENAEERLWKFSMSVLRVPKEKEGSRRVDTTPATTPVTAEATTVPSSSGLTIVGPISGT